MDRTILPEESLYTSCSVVDDQASWQYDALILTAYAGIVTKRFALVCLKVKHSEHGTILPGERKGTQFLMVV